MGSWDPSLSAMVNLTYVGTHLLNGKPDNDTACVTGLDEVGFVIGTSSSLFSVSEIVKPHKYAIADAHW
jgi:lysophospholipase